MRWGLSGGRGHVHRLTTCSETLMMESPPTCGPRTLNARTMVAIASAERLLGPIPSRLAHLRQHRALFRSSSNRAAGLWRTSFTAGNWSSPLPPLPLPALIAEPHVEVHIQNALSRAHVAQRGHDVRSLSVKVSQIQRWIMSSSWWSGSIKCQPTSTLDITCRDLIC